MQKSQFHDFISREVHTDQQIVRSEAVVAIASKLAFKAVLFFSISIYFLMQTVFIFDSLLFLFVFRSVFLHPFCVIKLKAPEPQISVAKNIACARFLFFSGLFRSSRSKTIMYVQ